jgi:CRP-like cAMP-binding protein
MASEKAQLTDSIQKKLSKSDWKSAIADMEKLFAIDPDPIVRVRIGDAYQKMNQRPEAVKEYVSAADLYAKTGVIVKALAQYKLALRLDPANQQVQQKISSLHGNKAMSETKTQPAEAGASKSVIPLFAGFSREEFEDFTKMMTVHTLPAGHTIVKQGETGKSVYVIASGTVNVHTTLPTGERLDLAVLNPNDFFGEMAFLAGKPRTATVETAEDAVILEVTEEQLGGLINRRPRMLQVLQQFSDAREKGTSQKMQSAQQTSASDSPAYGEVSLPNGQPETAAGSIVLEAPVPPPIAAPSTLSERAIPAAHGEKPITAPPPYKGPVVKLADKPKLVEAIQKQVGKANWKAAIEEMEKLFSIDPDPIIRVRIGDAYQKLNQKSNAAREYLYAADQYAETGAVVKALAQYKLALRIEPGSKQAQERIEALHSNKTVKENRVEPVEKGGQKPSGSVIPLFAGFSQEEFNDFTKVMNAHPLPEGMPVVEQNDTGKSVYLIASGSVKVYMNMLAGERVDLAMLRSGEFFGEMSFLTGKPRTATVETAEDSVILEITEDNLREITARRPHILEVLQQFSEKRSKGTTEKIQESNKG